MCVWEGGDGGISFPVDCTLFFFCHFVKISGFNLKNTDFLNIDFFNIEIESV